MKNYKNSVIYFTRYVHKKLIKLLRLHYHEIMERNGEWEKYMMLNDFMLDEVLEKIRMIISTEKFDETKILIGADNKLPDDVTLKNVV